ncbi:MAG: nucleoside-diphosphate kinase [Rickettsiales bacterium]|jgi:nucleoside-diphosphate kinase|nr:nucleoside-diphosphate kinase [Rickettsiales bacterium]
MFKVEKTLSIIKPDAMKKQISGLIINRIEKEGFVIVAQKKILLTKKQAELFYREHSAKPFFNDLTTHMSSFPIIAQVLEKENAVVSFRTLMGATDPDQAEEGTLRRDFGSNITLNAVHGSDSIESAFREINFFFSYLELISDLR